MRLHNNVLFIPYITDLLAIRKVLISPTKLEKLKAKKPCDILYSSFQGIRAISAIFL